MKGTAIPVRLTSAVPHHVKQNSEVTISGVPFRIVRISGNRLLIYVWPKAWDDAPV